MKKFMFEDTFPEFVESGLRPLQVKTMYEFDSLVKDWLRMEVDYSTLPNGAEEQYCKDNVCTVFGWNSKEQTLTAGKHFLTSQEEKEYSKDLIKNMMLDIYDNKRFDCLFVADFAINRQDQYTFQKKDLQALCDYLTTWVHINPTKPIFAVGHADETEVLLHWHVVFIGQMDYSRSKRISYLKKKVAFIEKGKTLKKGEAK